MVGRRETATAGFVAVYGEARVCARERGEGVLRVIGSLSEWANEIVEMPVPTRMARRTVLVPSEAVAHALRRELIEQGALHALSGTRFRTLLELASELVGEASEPVQRTEVAPLHALLRRALAEVEFAALDRASILADAGSAAVFARTLRELDEAQLGASQLLLHRAPAVRDLGRLLEELSGQDDLQTEAALLRAAASLLRGREPEAPTLALVSGFESAVEAQLLLAIPGVRLVRWNVRPETEPLRSRWLALYGAALEPGAAGPTATRAPERSALASVQARRFEPGPSGAASWDDSLRLVRYASVHEEIDAAVAWLFAQRLDHGLLPHELAIVSATPDRYFGPLHARLAALRWEGAPPPVYVEHGLPLVARNDAGRLASCLRALAAGLAREELAELLPSLRGREQVPHVSGLSRAFELLNQVAHVGGSRADLRPGRAWPEAWERALLRLEQPDDGEPGDATERRYRRALQLELAALAPAIEELAELLRAVIADEPLSLLCMRLAPFVETRLRLAESSPSAWSLLERAAASFDGHEEREPSGATALGWLLQALQAARVPVGEPQLPALHLGSLEGMRGRSFRALRVLGLGARETSLAALEDPLLDDDRRSELSPLLPTRALHGQRELAAYDDALGAARTQVVLSVSSSESEAQAARPWLLELTSVLSTVAGTGSWAELARVLGEGTAKERRELPNWLRYEQACRVPSARALDAALAPLPRAGHDGLLSRPLPKERVHGLTEERPLSTRKLALLLSCPHRYLLEQTLGFRAADELLPAHTLAAPLLERLSQVLLDEFAAAHQHDLSARVRPLAWYEARLFTEAREQIELLRASYPFADEASAERAGDALWARLRPGLVALYERPRRAEQAPLTFVVRGAQRQLHACVDLSASERERPKGLARAWWALEHGRFLRTTRAASCRACPHSGLCASERALDLPSAASGGEEPV